MCKVKSVIIAVFIIIPFILGAVVTVKPPGQGGDYDCIQDAIDDIEHEYVYEDTIEIYPSSGDDWEEDITINDINLRMIGIGDVSIKNRTGNTTILYTLSGNYQVALENLTIKNEDDEKVVYASASRGGSTSLTLIDCEFEGDSANYNRLVDTNMIEIVDISGCTFNGIQAPNYQNPCKLINCVDSDQIIITDNIFTGTSDYAICSRIHIDSEYACEISNNTISDCKYAILLDCSGDTEVEIKENLIFDLLNGAYALCIEKPSDPNDSEISFTNNTLYCSSGFTKYVFANATNEFVPTEIVNNIFHSFDGFMDNSATIPTEFDIDYNCCNVTLNDAGAGDTNNITGDPQFVDAGSDDYHLEQESPCIDSGDPSFDHDDDGTVSDMGYFTGDDHDLARFLESDGATVNINWIGFPRLDVTDGENNGEYVEATDMLDLLEYTDNPEEIEVYYLLSTSSLYGEWNNEYEYYDWDTDPCANLINSIRGYKIKVWDSGLSSSYLRVFGDVIDPETDITVDVRKDENWVCYFLEDTQDAEDAFSSGALTQLYKIITKNWTAIKTIFGWSFPQNSTLRYGDLVILVDDSDADFDFNWQEPAREIIAPYERPEPTQFSYQEEMNYLPIFMEFTEEVPLEVAVYVDNVCKGAEVVDSDGLFQLRAYVLEEEPGYELEFVFYNGRSEKQVMAYRIDNSFSQYSTDILITGSLGDYAFIEFGEPLSDQVPELETSLRAYPNPFNPTIQLSFQAGQYGIYDMTIYNLKGQKVKTIMAKSYCSEGERIEKVWKGLDNNGKQVSGGIYFVRLISPYDEQVSKIVLLK